TYRGAGSDPGLFPARSMTAAAAVPIAWQSTSDAISPPYTYPGMATWYGRGLNRAVPTPADQIVRM
ncbi:MAG: hypothetical protein ACLFRX_07675, partial [Gemmatimonadota bacterium]